LFFKSIDSLSFFTSAQASSVAAFFHSSFFDSGVSFENLLHIFFAKSFVSSQASLNAQVASFFASSLVYHFFSGTAIKILLFN
jgi:hypothetical protein